ncbi:hypothetical protein Fcan01_16338 [Folsomia candida]|uniref:Uncharacterized protein n=1 Tax=Folsomia candida TaxID=158441 RepID=A0A226DUT7_FOLCA|nr:hypothetical protein Fcan01_16338 [Folsomia candida]
MAYQFNSLHSFLFFVSCVQFCQLLTAVKIGSSDRIQDPVQLQLNDYFLPFENCTSMAIIPRNLKIQSLEIDNNPILLLNKTCRTYKYIEHRFGLQRRLNPSRHCWASFVLLTGNDQLGNYLVFNGNHLFIRVTMSSQYLIFLSTTKSGIQDYLKLRKPVTHKYGRREIIIIEVSLHKDEMARQVCPKILQLHYYNVNHHPDLKMMDGEPSKSWYSAKCLISKGGQDCFRQIQMISQRTASLNEYYWRIPAVVKNENVRTIAKKLTYKVNLRKMYKQLIALTVLNEFVAFWLLQEVWDKHSNITACYEIPVLEKPIVYDSQHEFIPHRSETFSFISCYKVKPVTGNILHALTSPLTTHSWIYLTFSLSIILLLVNVSRSKIGFEGALILIGVCLESSVLDRLESYKRTLPMNYLSLRVHFLLGVWTILIGTVLTNWYKAFFTIEMIVPATYPPPWTSFLDIDGMQAYLPFELLADTRVDNSKVLGGFRYLTFFTRLRHRAYGLTRDPGKSKVFKQTRKLAQFIVRLIPRISRKIAYHEQEELFYNQILPISPIKPIGYDETDRIVKTLSKCGKQAFLDTKENINLLLPFFNDNPDGVKFLTGEDPLFVVTPGWLITPVRHNYVAKRLKIIISSGIYSHWENYFRLVKPPRLFHNFANWTSPKFDVVSQLSRNSKIVTGFYICGICVVGCALCLGLEMPSTLGYTRLRKNTKKLMYPLNYLE